MRLIFLRIMICFMVLLLGLVFVSCSLYDEEDDYRIEKYWALKTTVNSDFNKALGTSGKNIYDNPEEIFNLTSMQIDYIYYQRHPKNIIKTMPFVKIDDVSYMLRNVSNPNIDEQMKERVINHLKKGGNIILAVDEKDVSNYIMIYAEKLF